MKDGLENIDEVFKQAFDGFEANVDPSVWSNIQNGINVGSTGGSAQSDPISSAVSTSIVKSVVVKIAAAVVAVGTIATATYYVATSPKGEAVVENVVENSVIDIVVAEQLEKTESPEDITKNEIDESNDNSSLIKDEVVKEENSTPVVKENELESNISNVGSNESNSNENKNEKTTTNTPETKTPSTSQNKREVMNAEAEPSLAPKTEVENPVKEPTTPKVEKPVKKEATVNAIPNVITPNGDGENDIIKISGENLEKLEVVVMDKTGKIIYKLDNIEQEWNGKDMNGFDLIPGVYYMAGVVVDKDGNAKNIKQAINLFK